MQQSILYYPHIEVRDAGWLKAALLLWDHVYRIIPAGYVPKDHGDLKVAVDSDGLRDAALDNQDKRQITESFNQFIEDLGTPPAGLVHDELAYLHPDKIDTTLYPQLERYAKGISDEGFLELPRELVRGYMFFLANKVAERRQLDRCTDDVYSFAVSPFFSENGNFSEYTHNLEAEGFYSSLILQDVLPLNLAEVPMKKVVEASRLSRDERDVFRVQLAKFAGHLAKCESEEHQKTILNDYRQDLEKAKADLRASQGFLNRNEQGSLFTIGLPVAASFMSLLGDPFSITTIAPSMLIGAIAAFHDYSAVQRRDGFNPHGAAYLVSLEKRFCGTGLLPTFDRYLHEFIDD